MLQIKFKANNTDIGTGFIDFGIDTVYKDIYAISYIFNFTDIANKKLYMAAPYSSSYYWHDGLFLKNGNTFTAINSSDGKIYSNWTKIYDFPTSGYDHFIVSTFGTSTDNASLLWLKISNS